MAISITRNCILPHHNNYDIKIKTYLNNHFKDIALSAKASPFVSTSVTFTKPFNFVILTDGIAVGDHRSGHYSSCAGGVR